MAIMPISIFAQYRFGGIGGIDMGGGISFGGIGGSKLTPSWDDDDTPRRKSDDQIEEDQCSQVEESQCSQIEVNQDGIPVPVGYKFQEVYYHDGVEYRVFYKPGEPLPKGDLCILAGILILTIALMMSIVLIATYDNAWKKTG